MPLRTNRNVRHGHLIKGTRDVSHFTWEARDQAVAEALRLMEKQRLDKANTFYTAVERIQTLLAEVRESEEELQAANEEMQASNEELQATNEELAATTEELERTSAYRQTLMNSMMDILMTTDCSGIITEVNSATERLSGYGRDELLGQPFSRFFTDPERAQAGIEQVLAKGQVYDYGLVVVSRDGGHVPVSYNATVLREPDGSVSGVLGSARDITELMGVEEELTRSNQELQQFAYLVSHDLKEPLRAVESGLEQLSRSYEGNPEAEAVVMHTLDGVSRMQGLINGLLAYSSVGAAGEDLELIESEAAVKRALSNLEVSIKESGAVVTQDPLPKVMADRMELGQVFQNLIGNGIKFRGRQPPRVHISAEKQPNEWLFSVRDNGVGIEAEDVDRIFQAFQRVHRDGKYAGSGIGLAICKKIIDRHGGRIWAESQPGKGSKFYFTISMGSEG
jgi:PAS domain S-box-containing protein